MVNSRLLCATIVLLCGLAQVSGCVSFQEEGFSIPHGTPIGHGDIPHELRAKMALPEDASVERYGNDPVNASYRVEHADGSISIIGPDGSFGGGLM